MHRTWHSKELRCQSNKYHAASEAVKLEVFASPRPLFSLLHTFFTRLLRQFEFSKCKNVPYHRLRTHGTGLETCHVSALNVCKTKRPRNSHLTGVRTLLSLHIIYRILYLKDRSGSCGTVLEKPWGLWKR